MSGATRRVARRGGAGAFVLFAGLLLVGCVTGETDSDARTDAVRRIVREAGVTADVAECIVDELEETVGLEVLDDAETPDDVSREINQIATDCLLLVPTASTTAGASTTLAPATSAPLATIPGAATTTIGAPSP